ncbi:beta strand repeat-containing protein, partial [Colwellia echini]
MKVKSNKPSKLSRANKRTAVNKPNKVIAAARATKPLVLSSTALSVCMAFSTYTLPTLLQTAVAGPEGGAVVGGSGDITKLTNSTIINQTSQQMAINWDSYNVNKNERVQYIQPNSQSISLNRILSSDGSTIAGNINANGQVFLVNPNGIVFTQSSIINVGGLVASSLDINPQAFLNGDYVFDALENINGNNKGAVINQGLINASIGGNVALIGSQVENQGFIQATLGTVNLAAGKQAVLTFDAGGLLGVSVSKEVLQSELGVDAAVINSGEINAQGGRVLLSASTSQDVFSQAVNAGMEHATSVVVHSDGSFTLGGGADVINSGSIDVSTTQTTLNIAEEFNLSTNTTTSNIVVLGDNVTNSGQLLANTSYSNGSNDSSNASQNQVRGEIELHAQNTTLLTETSITSATGGEQNSGGVVKVLGDKVGLLDSASVDVSGHQGGGEVYLGGDYRGENSAIRNASASYLGRDTQVSANGLTNGDGGKVILWGNDLAKAYGSISATGGSENGNGGFVETSAKVVDLDLSVNVGAISGDSGTWLIDPYNITISGGATIDDDNISIASPFTNSAGRDSNLSIFTLEGSLTDGANIIIETGVGGNAEEDVVFNASGTAITDGGAGNITLLGALNFSDGGTSQATLTLNAHNDINIQADITTGDSDRLNLNLNADHGNDGSGTYVTNGTGDVNIKTGVSIETNGGSFEAKGASFTSELASIITTGYQGQNAGIISITANTGSITTGVLTANGGAANSNSGGKNAGTITLLAETDITIAGAVSAIGSDGDYTNGGSEFGGNGSLISLTSTTSDIHINASMNSSGGDADLGNSNENGGVGGGITISAANEVNITEQLVSYGGIGVINGNGGSGGEVSISGFDISLGQDINTSGGAGNDTFANDGTVEVNLLGENAKATISHTSAFTTLVTIDGTAATTSVGGEISLTGPDVAINWNITDEKEGNLVLEAGDSDTNLNLEFSGITSLVGGTSADNFIFDTSGVINVDGGGGLGTNTLTGRVAENDWNVTSNNSGILSVKDDVFGDGDVYSTFSNIQNLKADDTKFIDIFKIAGDLYSLEAGGGEDNITVTAGVIDSIDSGAWADTITISGGSVGTLKTQTGSDNIMLASLDLVGDIDGGYKFGQTNTLTITGTNQTVDLSKISNIDKIYGESTDAGDGNTLKESGAVTHAWNINGTNEGGVDGIEFYYFGNLEGGEETDNFTVNAGASIGNISGGNGVNTYAINGTAGAIT